MRLWRLWTSCFFLSSSNKCMLYQRTVTLRPSSHDDNMMPLQIYKGAAVRPVSQGTLNAAQISIKGSTLILRMMSGCGCLIHPKYYYTAVGRPRDCREETVVPKDCSRDACRPSHPRHSAPSHSLRGRAYLCGQQTVGDVGSAGTTTQSILARSSLQEDSAR